MDKIVSKWEKKKKEKRKIGRGESSKEQLKEITEKFCEDATNYVSQEWYYHFVLLFQWNSNENILKKKEHESNQKIIRFFYRYSLVYIEHLFIINKINKKWKS